MKYKFNLEKVLQHRRIIMDNARKDYSEAQSFLQTENEIYKNLIIQKEQALEQRSRLVNTTTGWQNHVASLNQFLTGQDQRIILQNQRLQKIEKVVESRREILKEAHIQVKILEQLKEKKKAEFFNQKMAEESRELDEISTLRFAQNLKDKTI